MNRGGTYHSEKLENHFLKKNASCIGVIDSTLSNLSFIKIGHASQCQNVHCVDMYHPDWEHCCVVHGFDPVTCLSSCVEMLKCD